MDTQVFLGPPSENLVEWAKKQIKFTLTLHMEYDGTTWYPNCRIEDEAGNRYPIDTPMKFAKGTAVKIIGKPRSSAESVVEHFVKWQDTGSTEAERIVVMDSDKEITGIFHQNVS